MVGLDTLEELRTRYFLSPPPLNIAFLGFKVRTHEAAPLTDKATLS